MDTAPACSWQPNIEQSTLHNMAGIAPWAYATADESRWVPFGLTCLQIPYIAPLKGGGIRARLGYC